MHGAAVKIIRTAEGLAQHGAHVVIVTENRDHYLRWDEGQWVEVPYAPRVRAAEEWPVVRRMGRFAEKLCGRVGYPSEETFLYRPIFDPAWWLRAAAVGKAEQIDWFQAEFPGYAAPAVLAARLCGARSSLVEHNIEYDRLAEMGFVSGSAQRRLEAIEVALAKWVDEVITVSVDDRDRLARSGVDASSVTVIPHGVDLQPFYEASGQGIRERYGISRNAPMLFFHGTLNYWPNTLAVRFIVESLLPRLLTCQPRLRVVIAGMNPPKYFEHPAVTFTGVVEDLADHIAACDVAVCPVPEGGGTRMKLLEYFAAGKPVVSTHKGAEGLVSRDGEEILLRDEPDDFAEAVLELLKDPERARLLGERGRAFVARYDWEPVTEAYLKLYDGSGRGEDWNARLLASEGRLPATGTEHNVSIPAAVEEVGAHLPARTPSKPLTMLLLVNRGCNLRCTFCDLWDRPAQMELEQLVPLLDEARSIGTKTLVITGGEPFLHKELFDAVRAAKARDMSVNITTNGTLVERRWDELIASGVNSLSFSLDGLLETHDLLRGRKGAFQQTLRALERVNADGRITCTVYFVVTKENVRELIPLYDLVRSMGVGFDFWPVNDAPHLALTSAEDQAVYREAVQYIGRFSAEVASRTAYYDEGLEYHEGVRGSVRCLGLIDQYGVTYEGHFLPCCVWGEEGIRVGNVFDTPLSELWTHPDVQAARKQLFTHGCDVGCFNHSLYEFTNSTGLPFRVKESVGESNALGARTIQGPKGMGGGDR